MYCKIDNMKKGYNERDVKRYVNANVNSLDWLNTDSESDNEIRECMEAIDRLGGDEPIPNELKIVFESNILEVDMLDYLLELNM